MKIGFDITALSMPKTGIGQYQFNLLNSLFKIDRENQYNLYAFNLRDNAKYCGLDFKIPFGNMRMHAYKIPQRLITAWWLMARWPRLENITEKCDLYQISEICQQPTRAKTVAFIHDITTILYPQYHLLKNKILYHYRFKGIKKYANAVLTNSQNTKRDIIERIGIPAERIFVTPFGVHERFRPIGKKNNSRVKTDITLGNDSGLKAVADFQSDSAKNERIALQGVLKKYGIEEPYICYLGTIEPRKNLVNLLQAFYELKNKEKIPHKLVLIGKDGWFYEEIYRKIGELGLGDDVVRTGFVSDEEVPYLLNGTEVFVYPSFYEGFGLPVLEAMACGVPVVTSSMSSLPEVGGDAVKYVNPMNHSDIAGRILEFVKSPSERDKYSKLGIERARNFTWNKCAKETLKIYKSL
ncbi:glycosyltransferase family 4 protein [Candidatus Peregrinibacteria bacterium]|nr:glycosyltransferase family 4 protein [Candidatus Peregrinibacteria bacterium]